MVDSNWLGCQVLQEKLAWKAHWCIDRYADDEQLAFAELGLGVPVRSSHVDQNLAVNEGTLALLTLLTGGTVSETAYDNANARLGVGTSNDAETIWQTDLQGTSLYVPMNAGYPLLVGFSQAQFQADFTGSSHNDLWQEFTIDNGPAALKNLNRKTSNQGTKSAGQTWRLTLTLTVS